MDKPKSSQQARTEYTPEVFRKGILRALEIAAEAYDCTVRDLQSQAVEGRVPDNIAVGRQLAAYIIFDVVGIKNKSFIAKYVFSGREHVHAVHWIRDARDFSSKRDKTFIEAYAKATAELSPVFSGRYVTGCTYDWDVINLGKTEKDLRRTFSGIQLSMFGVSEFDIRQVTGQLKRLHPEWTPHVFVGRGRFEVGWIDCYGLMVLIDGISEKMKKYYRV